MLAATAVLVLAWISAANGGTNDFARPTNDFRRTTNGPQSPSADWEIGATSSWVSTSCVSCVLLGAEPSSELTPPPPPPPVEEDPPELKRSGKRPLIHEGPDVGGGEYVPPPHQKTVKKIPTQDPHLNSFSLREIGLGAVSLFYMDLTLPLGWLAFASVFLGSLGSNDILITMAGLHAVTTIVAVSVLQYGTADPPTENGLLFPLIGNLAGTLMSVGFFVLAATSGGGLIVPFILAGVFARYTVGPILASVLLHRRFGDKPIEPERQGVEVLRF